ncbi:MAG: nickel pincer cofactor biosynthesis protein LarC [Gemmatimonadota bacterium]|nr:MAG: nickel pincer cofactor biosynthesis protein LarC [Gemmatimonadota bacterium]
MKLAYFDCFSGISGDMILGALVYAGLSLEALRTALSKLPLEGYELSASRTERHGISATKVEVTLTKMEPARHLKEITDIIDESTVSHSSKEAAKRIFRRLAEAEAKIHNTTPEKVHFHEVGATDALVDVLGAVIGLESLGVHDVYASHIRLGSGYVRSEHGTIPVPAPATLELIRGVPSQRTSIRGELTTPTGAAIITTLAKSFDDVPLFVPEAIGYGAGTKKFDEIPNLLRIEIGRARESYVHDRSVVIETNIDDMNPEIYSYVIEKLLAEGAQDVTLSPIIMKKGRPGILLRVLVEPHALHHMSHHILQETTTLGLRISPVERLKAKRETIALETKYGRIRVKAAAFEGTRRFTPEYDDCRKAAMNHKIPILEIYEEVRKKLHDPTPSSDVQE